MRTSPTTLSMDACRQAWLEGRSTQFFFPYTFLQEAGEKEKTSGNARMTRGRLFRHCSLFVVYFASLFSPPFFVLNFSLRFSKIRSYFL